MTMVKPGFRGRARRILAGAVYALAIAALSFFAGAAYVVLNAEIGIESEHVATMTVLGRTDVYYVE